MFPDMMAPAPGYYVGVVLSSELPAADREMFQNLLSQMTDLRVQVSPVRPQHHVLILSGEQMWPKYLSIYHLIQVICSLTACFHAVFLSEQIWREMIL